MTRDELELRLVEQIKLPWFGLTDDDGNPIVPTDDDLAVDMELVESVAGYLIDVEELGGDDSSDVVVMTVALFIYGYVIEQQVSS